MTKSTGKPTLIAVGLFVYGTGFTRMFNDLLSRLSGDYMIHWLGIGYKGPQTLYGHYTLHPCNLHGGDIYGAYGAAALAVEMKAHAILLLNDLYMLKNYEEAWSPLRERNIRLLAYAPLDGYITNAAIVQEFLFLDDLVLYATWAKEEIAKAMQSVAKAPRLHAIYHGVDNHFFTPASDSVAAQQIRERLFGPQQRDSIFILNANRINERKDIRNSIRAFTKALPQFKKTAYLCLQAGSVEPHIQNDTQQLIEESGCAENILLNPLGTERADDDSLRELYRACQIGINSSLGEGWGMIAFEHAACGAAQIVPAHSTPGEIWRDIAITIPSSAPVQLSTNPFLMYAVDTDEFAAALIKLVNDADHLSDVSKKCFDYANDSMFDWEQIALQWKALLAT